jgi:hypothetical protein
MTPIEAEFFSVDTSPLRGAYLAPANRPGILTINKRNSLKQEQKQLALNALRLLIARLMAKHHLQVNAGNVSRKQTAPRPSGRQTGRGAFPDSSLRDFPQDSF